MFRFLTAYDFELLGYVTEIDRVRPGRKFDEIKADFDQIYYGAPPLKRHGNLTLVVSR